MSTPTPFEMAYEEGELAYLRAKTEMTLAETRLTNARAVELEQINARLDQL